MNKIIVTTLAVFGLFAIITINACKQDKCKHVSCAYASICKEGKCICNVGYEGVQCETVSRDKFKGIWDINEDGTLSSAAQYSVSIENGAKVNEVVIKNFQNNFVTNVVGIVYRDTLTIPIATYGNYTVEGKATIIDTDPLNQHYYQHAVMNVTYKVKNNTTLNVDEYGTNGAGPSIWAK